MSAIGGILAKFRGDVFGSNRPEDETAIAVWVGEVVPESS